MQRTSPRRRLRWHGWPYARTVAVIFTIGLIASACGTPTADDALASSNQAPTTSPPPTTTTTTTTTTTVAPTTTTAAPTPSECAARVPLEQQIGQLMFPVIVQTEFETAAELASDGLLGGVVVLGNPSASIADDIARYQQASLLGPGVIAVDEEGGRVQRLSSLTTALPSAGTVGSTFSLDEAAQLAEDHARAIGELGFTMNLAPVVDLDNGGFIGDRAFGEDPEQVVDFAFATADGILAAGLDPVIKHFPGHGRGLDSHTGLPTIPGVETLRETDLVPFVEAAERGDLPIMVGHLVVEGLTNGQPASISPAAIDGLLRTDIGFDGLVMTDALNMDAIANDLNNAEAAELSLAAGVDLIMLGSVADTALTIERIVEAVENGRISNASITASFLRVMETRGLAVCGSIPADDQ